MNEFIFWAQNLNNTGGDYLYKNEEEIVNIEQRQNIVGEMSNLSSQGEMFWKNENELVIAYRQDSKFLLRVVLPERDKVGRVSRILCYGNIPEKLDEVWIDRCITLSHKFVEDIGRTFPADIENSVRTALRRLRPKRFFPTLPINLFLTAFTLLLFLRKTYFLAIIFLVGALVSWGLYWYQAQSNK